MLRVLHAHFTGPVLVVKASIRNDSTGYAGDYVIAKFVAFDNVAGVHIMARARVHLAVVIASLPLSDQPSYHNLGALTFTLCLLLQSIIIIDKLTVIYTYHIPLFLLTICF